MKKEDDLSYFNKPEFKEILKRYEELRLGDNSIILDAEELTDIAEYCILVKKDKEAANACITYALNLYPDATAPLVFEARQHMIADDIEKARMLCMAIPEQEQCEVTYLWAELLIRDKKPEAALSYIENRAELYTDDYDYYLYDAAYIFIDYTYFAEAYIIAHQLQAYAPEWYKTWELTADCLLGLEKYEEALVYINRMLDADPFSTEAWNWAAEAHLELGHSNEAIDATEYSLAIDPKCVRAIVLKTTAFIHLQNYVEAINLANQALAINPSDEFVLTQKAYCQMATDMLDEAEATIIEAERIADGQSPDQQAIYEQHAYILGTMERYEEALAYLDKAESIDHKINYDSIRAEYLQKMRNL